MFDYFWDNKLFFKKNLREEEKEKEVTKPVFNQFFSGPKNIPSLSTSHKKNSVFTYVREFKKKKSSTFIYEPILVKIYMNAKIMNTQKLFIKYDLKGYYRSQKVNLCLFYVLMDNFLSLFFLFSLLLCICYLTAIAIHVSLYFFV